MPTFDFAIRLRVIRRSPDVRHARDANELLEVFGDKLRPVVGNDSRFNAGILRFRKPPCCPISLNEPANGHKPNESIVRLKNGHSLECDFLFILFAILVSGLRIAREYQRAVVFRLGRYNDLRGPGLFWLIPLGIENEVRIDLRIVTSPIEQQETITRDSVTVKVNAVLWFRVNDPEKGRPYG